MKSGDLCNSWLGSSQWGTNRIQRWAREQHPPKKKWYSNSFLNSVHLSEKEKTNIPSYLDAIPPLGIKVVIRNSKALLNQKEAMEWPNVARQSAAQDCLAHFFFTGLLNIQTSSFHHLRHLFPGPEMKPTKCKKSSLRSLGPTSNLQGSSYIGISGCTKSHGKAKRILHLSTVRLNGFILWFAPFGPDNSTDRDEYLGCWDVSTFLGGAYISAGRACAWCDSWWVTAQYAVL